MEWSTHQVVEATGITSRTLRHYDQIGLLPPTRTGAGGLRYYDQLALVRPRHGRPGAIPAADGSPQCRLGRGCCIGRGARLRIRATKGPLRCTSMMSVSQSTTTGYRRQGPQFVRDAVHHWADQQLED